jgi:hypothetical protein
MPEFQVFTKRSLIDLLGSGLIIEALSGQSGDQLANAIKIETETNAFYMHRDDVESTPLIAVRSEPLLAQMPHRSMRRLEAVLKRILSFVEHASRRSIQLPNTWAQYKAGSLISFLAANVSIAEYSRVIAESDQAAGVTVIWTIADKARDQRLEDYDPPRRLLTEVLTQKRRVIEIASSLFAGVDPGQMTIDGDLDLQTPASPVVGSLTYSGWKAQLTDRQQAFLNAPVTASMKLKGPAGSGKTLALELKALHEVKRARDDGQGLRVLFATHSWSMAYQIDDDLRMLDEQDWSSAITVLPLLSLAESSQTDEWKTSLTLVGEDSYESKSLLLDRIAGLWNDLRNSDWVTFVDDCSDVMRSRVEAEGRQEQQALVWDTLIEFGCVLGAEGIFPGVKAESRYRQLHRSPWMMPVLTDGDRQLILHLYRKYIDGLLQDELITSDQVISDYLNLLEGYAWNVRRRAEGYDLIFIDELHLFNSQERMVVSYLTREPDAYPKVLMAMDPRQSPWERYVNFATASEIRTVLDPSSADPTANVGQSFELDVVHRSSPQICALIKHIHHEFPALELGADWAADYSSVQSSGVDGLVPVMIMCGTVGGEHAAVVRALDSMSSTCRGRIALAVVDESRFAEYEDLRDVIARRTRRNVSVIEGRSDLDTVANTPRCVVLGPVEYLAGMQFEGVVVAGLRNDFGGANVGHRLRRSLSSIYLGVSRAESHVIIVSCDEWGGLPEVLERAAQAGVARSAEDRSVV